MGKGSYGEDPDWANPDNTTTPAPTQNAGITGSSLMKSTNGSGGGGTGSSGRGRDSYMLVGLSLAGMGVAAMMTALGVLGLIGSAPSGISDLSPLFLSCYMIMFAVLLFLYELMWWMAIPFINKTLRKNFGFFYGLKGKGFYLIFVAFLCLGLAKDSRVSKALTWATGISFLAVGVLHFLVVCSFPSVADIYRGPTAGLETLGGGDEVV